MDYRDILKQLYSPDIGTLWKVPNRIWTTGFAKNKEADSLHPAIVEKQNPDKISVLLAPGTTKEYQKGSCVFKVDISNNGKYSYFLLKLSMPYVIEDLLKLERGWDGVLCLSEQQLEEFKLQIKFCKG